MFRFQIYDSSGDYLESQRWWIFSILMTVGGFLGHLPIPSVAACSAMPRRQILYFSLWPWGMPSGAGRCISSFP